VGLHHDIFETTDHGAHHGANPGASMIASVPCYIFKPALQRLDNYFSDVTRKHNGEVGAAYNDHRLPRVKFYRQVRERGWDIKFGLVSALTMVFCMAPLSALGAVVMFGALNFLGLSKRVSLWLAFLFAFGTPVFFRTAYLNQNLMVGIFAFIGFVQLWQVEEKNQDTYRKRFAIAGFLGGLTVLCDYSGLVPLIMLYGYGILRRGEKVPMRNALRESLWYFGGAALPICMLWFYQWRSFGYPFYPPQYSMPHQIYSDVGYQGIRWPSGELLWMLLFDIRFGLFVVCPLLLLSFCAPLLNYFRKNILELRETLFILCFFAAFTLFFSFIEYTRLQWVTGIRYIIPVVPFLFLLTASVLVRIPRYLAYLLTVLAVIQLWAMSMARRGVGVPEESMLASLKAILFEGFQLPWLNTLLKMKIPYIPYIQQYLSPFLLFVLLAILIFAIWRFKSPWEKLEKSISSSARTREVSS
jgi:hypothetical protein